MTREQRSSYTLVVDARLVNFGLDSTVIKHCVPGSTLFTSVEIF